MNVKKKESRITQSIERVLLVVRRQIFPTPLLRVLAFGQYFRERCGNGGFSPATIPIQCIYTHMNLYVVYNIQLLRNISWMTLECDMLYVLISDKSMYCVSFVA